MCLFIYIQAYLNSIGNVYQHSQCSHTLAHHIHDHLKPICLGPPFASAGTAVYILDPWSPETV